MRISIWRYAHVLLLSVALSACSLPQQLIVFNGSHDTVTVQSGGGLAGVIPPRRSDQFGYYSRQRSLTLRVSTPSCERLYQLPKAPPPFEHYRSISGIKVQIESDFSIDLIPPDATGLVSVAGLAALQQDGFPLRPYSQSCPGQT